MASCLDCVLFWMGLSQKPPMALILNSESPAVDTIAKEASLPITDSGSVDHGLPYGCWQPAARNTHINRGPTSLSFLYLPMAPS